MTVHVCPIKDSECGHRPDNWCDDCPLRAAAPQAQPQVRCPNKAAIGERSCSVCKGDVLECPDYYNPRAALSPAPPQAQPAPCIGRDPLCPCQDGDSCHYRDTATTKAWPIPAQPAPAGYCARASAGVIECLCAESEQRGCAEWRSYHAQPAPAEPPEWGLSWKVGNEYAPYHPQASHCPPDFRDGWNACYEAGRAFTKPPTSPAIAALARSPEPAPTLPSRVDAILAAIDKIMETINQRREPGWSYRNTITTNREHIREQCAAIKADLAAPEPAPTTAPRFPTQYRAVLPPERKPVLNPMCAWPFPEPKP